MGVRKNAKVGQGSIEEKLVIKALRLHSGYAHKREEK